MDLCSGRSARTSREGAQGQGPPPGEPRQGTDSYTEPLSEKDAILILPRGVGLSTAGPCSGVWGQEGRAGCRL